MKKIWNIFIQKVWKDPVWSKVISAVIILVIATIWTGLSNYTFSEMIYFISDLLTEPFPIYLTLSIVGTFILVKYATRFFKKKKHLNWDEQVGNFKFKELYIVLQSQNYQVKTVGMGFSNQEAPENDLLTLFMLYTPMINMGVTLDRPHDDGGYLYGVLCPKLISYGLVTKTITREEELSSPEYIRYDMSEIGHKFHSLVEIVNRLEKKV